MAIAAGVIALAVLPSQVPVAYTLATQAASVSTARLGAVRADAHLVQRKHAVFGLLGATLTTLAHTPFVTTATTMGQINTTNKDQSGVLMRFLC